MAKAEIFNPENPVKDKDEQRIGAEVKLDVLHTLSMQELLNFRDGNEILLAFYDNEMKTYATEFGVNDEERYKGAVKQVQKYLKVREYLFNEIKKRIDVIYEKDLA